MTLNLNNNSNNNNKNINKNILGGGSVVVQQNSEKINKINKTGKKASYSLFVCRVSVLTNIGVNHGFFVFKELRCNFYFLFVL